MKRGIIYFGIAQIASDKSGIYKSKLDKATLEKLHYLYS